MYDMHACMYVVRVEGGLGQGRVVACFWEQLWRLEVLVSGAAMHPRGGWKGRGGSGGVGSVQGLCHGLLACMR